MMGGSSSKNDKEENSKNKSEKSIKKETDTKNEIENNEGKNETKKEIENNKEENDKKLKDNDQKMDIKNEEKVININNKKTENNKEQKMDIEKEKKENKKEQKMGIEKEENKKEQKMGIEKEENNKEQKMGIEKEENKKEKENKEEKKPKKEMEINELEELINYKYNEKGELVHKTTGEKCGRVNTQKEYELIGEYVEKYIEIKLIETFNLVKLYVPNNNSTDFTKRDENQSQCKILTSQDFPTNPKCLMLIQGTGAVRLGQWARSVCINENIYLGSMIPYVKKALENKWSIIIYNPNERRDFINKYNIIKEFPTMEKHSLYVYNNIVKTNNNIKEIYIVAHSMGGECTVQILLDNKEDLLSGKIKKIAFTDSVHGSSYNKLGKEGIDKFREISRNYICSDEPAGEFIRSYEKAYGGVNCYSSGHNRHEYTSGFAIEEIFKFFNE